MLDALILADQLRAGDRPVIAAHAADGDIAAVELLAQCLEAGQRLGLETAVGQFLDPVGQPALQEAAIVGRWLRAEQRAPLRLQHGDVGDFEGLEAPEHVGLRDGRRGEGGRRSGLGLAGAGHASLRLVEFA